MHVCWRAAILAVEREGENLYLPHPASHSDKNSSMVLEEARCGATTLLVLQASQA